MRLFVFLFCLTFIYSCTNKDKLRSQLQNKINKLSKEKAISYNDSASVSYLKDSCTKEELLKLINNQSPIVRVLAYRAIVYRKEPDYFAILKNHLSDTAKVAWWYFDDASNEFTVSDLMLIKAESAFLNRQQKDTLIDLVLKDHIYLGTAKWIMKEMAPQEKYYLIIRNQAKSIPPAKYIFLKSKRNFSLAY